jgi:hypothetical protein
MARRLFKRTLLGYRAADVEAAIAQRDSYVVDALREVNRAQAEVLELELVAKRLSERVVLRERELRDVRGELERARIERDEAIAALAAAAKPEPAAEADAEPAGAAANGNGHHAQARPADIFAGLVEVEVGPLSDFAQLVGLEDAMSEIGGTGEISVKRFTKGRATLEMHLREPVELLRELEERAPFEFRVRDTRDDRVVLDVDAE